MRIQQVVPQSEWVELTDVVASLRTGSGFRPFSDEILQFCAEYSRAIFADPEAKNYPELHALAFWMRKAELIRLRDDFLRGERDSLLAVPRGLVFHLPPGNVDTIFVYSWLMSVLAGNRNVLRLSLTASPQTDILCRLYREVLQSSDPALAHNTLMIRYGHEREITAALSAICDLRVIWGGDATVNTIRAIPIPPHARELTFPDRFSLSAIQARSYLAADGVLREQLAARFYNDLFWFDQMACSSPRLLVWCGETADCAEASQIFFESLRHAISKKQYASQIGSRMNKFTFACQAILDGAASGYQEVGPHLTLLPLSELANFRAHCGGGLLFQFYAPSLGSMIPALERRDQTLTYFGFNDVELRDFARQANGRGIDRIVPFGSALAFQRYWDGCDLLGEMTRNVYICDTKQALP